MWLLWCHLCAAASELPWPPPALHPHTLPIEWQHAPQAWRRCVLPDAPFPGAQSYLRELFAMMDINADNVLERSELKELFRLIVPDVPTLQLRYLMSHFQKIDADGVSARRAPWAAAAARAAAAALLLSS
jgi:hypothetical protein